MKPDLPHFGSRVPLARFFAPGLLLLLALALRLYLLDAQSFWADEVLSVWHAQVPLPTLLPALPVDHTPGYWVLLHFWLPLGGDVDFSLRFFSVWWGVLSVALVYALGRELASPRLGLMAAALLGLSPFAIYQSQEARMYTQLLAFGAASLLTLAWAYAQPTRRNWILHTLAVACALYTHYYGLSLVPAAGVFLLLERRGRTRTVFSAWLVSMAGVAALFSPWVPHLLQLLRTQTWQPAVDPWTWPAQMYATFLTGTGLPVEAEPWTIGLALLVLAAGAWVARRRWQGRMLLLAAVLPAPLIVLALTLRGQGLFARYLIPLLPAFLLLAALGLAWIWQRSPPAGGVVLAVLLGVSFLSLNNLWYDPHYSRPGWRPAARFLAARERAGDLILVENDDPGLELGRYYHGQAALARAPDPGRAARFDSEMRRVTGQAPRVWLVVHGGDRDQVEAWLNQEGFEGDYEEFAGVYVYPFLLDPPLSAPLPPAETSASGGIALLQYQAGAAVTGAYLPVTLTWLNGPAPQDAPLAVSLRLVDETGRVRVALDREPRAGFYPVTDWQPRERVADAYALWIPPDLPAGGYTLRVVVYHPDGGAPVLEATLGPVAVQTAR